MARRILAYNPRLKQLARNLRNNCTKSEAILWQRLKGKQLLGCDFDRQRPISEYIVDFFCQELMLAIEIDGETHVDKEVKDEIRQKKLESLGIKFLRFRDLDIFENLDAVLGEIVYWVDNHK